jgi:hypothetical protein
LLWVGDPGPSIFHQVAQDWSKVLWPLDSLPHRESLFSCIHIYILGWVMDLEM